MRPVRIAGADPLPIGAPADWNAEQHGHCSALFVRREIINGVPYMRSAHEPEVAEALSIVAGAAIEVGIQGVVHPVVQLGVGPLPDHFPPTVVARQFCTLQGQLAARVEMMFPHGGGRRGFIECIIESSFAATVAHCIGQLEQLAVKEGWAG